MLLKCIRQASRATSRLNVRSLSTRDPATFSEAIAGGNPMFPQPAAPKMKDGDGQKKDDDDKKSKSDETFASRHWAKFSAVAMATSIALLYNYFQGYRNRTAKEEEITAAQAIEPHEVNEIRMTSEGLSVNIYNDIMSSIYEKYPSKHITYTDFIDFVTSVCREKGIVLRGGHLFDRILEYHLARQALEAKEGDDSDDGGSENVGLYNTLLPISYLLTILNLALQARATDRCDALFLLARMDMHGNAIYKDTTQELNRALTALDEEYDSKINQFTKKEYTIKFIPSTTFNGAKEGYAFYMGDQGVGYYVDSKASDSMKARLIKEKNRKRDVLIRQTGSNMDETIDREQASTIVDHLANSCQIPGDRQVITTGVKYPVELYRKKTARELVESGMKAWKMEDIQQLNRQQFRDIVLGRDICAWAECFRK